MSILLSGDFHAGMSGEMYAINKKIHKTKKGAKT
jgi:hypothetical protein